MKLQRTRLDRLVSERGGVHRKEVRLLLAQGRIHIDGRPADSINQAVGPFTRVTLDARVLQANKARYVMLHKPSGVVSATRDKQHKTVIDLVSVPYSSELHIVGRLDFNSTGLMLLTNDGRWSRSLSDPQNNIAKTYRVLLEKALDDSYVKAFADGMYFDFEGVTTRPAELRILGQYEAEVDLIEGRYHQIKRMFGRFDNRVKALHRTSVGSLSMAAGPALGQWRELTLSELDLLGLEHCCLSPTE
ncbi:pseudouridine synthase [Candidatus Seongchinamella marina]|jgi:16S rRNA pseudouridine516 synthase|uniref:pseudouridine synthase n=1 Tax=Candidatus Seongchinamella marina TaxID=2518990 RepID=UPI00242E3B85|nr:16S rRNA pseudouridine(516) synthase [Candidatus Seongchinamella marina]